MAAKPIHDLSTTGAGGLITADSARTHSQELQNSASMAVPPVPITLWPVPITVGCARAPRSADNDVASLATCSWVPDGASGINQGMGSSNQCDVKSTIRTMEPAPRPDYFA